MTRSLHAAAFALLLLTACAPDAHGDLRTRVAVHPAGAPCRLTWDGVGVGSTYEDGVAAFGDGELPPSRAADFGTRLDVLWRPRADGAVDGFVLRYGGSPPALSRLAARWEEVFRAAGADCGGGACFWTECGDVLASLHLERRWLVPAGLIVTVER